MWKRRSDCVRSGSNRCHNSHIWINSILPFTHIVDVLCMCMPIAERLRLCERYMIGLWWLMSFLSASTMFLLYSNKKRLILIPRNHHHLRCQIIIVKENKNKNHDQANTIHTVHASYIRRYKIALKFGFSESDIDLISVLCWVFSFDIFPPSTPWNCNKPQLNRNMNRKIKFTIISINWLLGMSLWIFECDQRSLIWTCKMSR